MKITAWIGLVLNTLLLIAAIFLFRAGSLETFPTHDQINDARLGWGLAIIVFLLIDISLVVYIRKMKK